MLCQEFPQGSFTLTLYTKITKIAFVGEGLDPPAQNAVRIRRRPMWTQMQYCREGQDPPLHLLKEVIV